MYYEIYCNNGYCGCDERHFVECEENEIDEIFNDLIANSYFYTFLDDRFVDYDEYETEEEAEEVYEQGIWDNSYYKELTKEEWEREREMYE